MSPPTLTITYRKPGTVPPIFVAGSFSSPPWELYELEHDVEDNPGSFSRTFSVSPGTYQYKFRLGTGDWWAFDDTLDTATDSQGNINNVVTVQERQTISLSPAMEHSPGEKMTETQIDPGHTNNETRESDLHPAVADLEASVQTTNGSDDPLPLAIFAPDSKDNPAISLSHDLPTPPVSERGDELDGMALQADAAEQSSAEPDAPVQAFNRSGDQNLSHELASSWTQTGMILLVLAVAVIPVVAWSLGQ